MECRLNQVDYTKYSLSELHEALESIDAYAFPENYQNLLAELEKPERKNEKVNIAKENKTDGNNEIQTRVFLTMCSCLMFASSYFIYISGVFMSRNNRREILNIHDNPIAFHLGVMALVFCGIFLFYKGVFGAFKSKKK